MFLSKNRLAFTVIFILSMSPLADAGSQTELSPDTIETSATDLNKIIPFLSESCRAEVVNHIEPVGCAKCKADGCLCSGGSPGDTAFCYNCEP